MLKVGIIDSGADLSGLDIPATRLSGINLCADGSSDNRDPLADNLDHGTTCIRIIRSYTEDISFFVVKILDTEPAANEDLLIEGIRQCLKAGVQIINISLGIQSPLTSDGLTEICDRAYESNVPIIAAAHNDSKICFPAYYPKVFGIGHLPLPSGTGFVFMRRSPVEFFTDGYFQFQGRHYNGSSFACPKMTGEALVIMIEKGPMTIEQLKNALIKKAVPASMPHPFIPNDYGYEQATSFDRTETAPLAEKYFYPTGSSSESRRILLLPLEDRELYFADKVDLGGLNPGLRITVGRHSYYPLHIPAIVSNEELYDQFDTLALGKLTSLLSLYNRTALYQQLREIIGRGKDFLVFDSVSYRILCSLQEKINASSVIHYPSITAATFRDFKRFRYLPALRLPVIAVMAGGKGEAVSAQGCVHKQLLDAGYAVSYISPVSQGILMGACFCVPISDPDTFAAGEEQLYSFLTHLGKAVQSFLKPDLILTGISGALLPPPGHNAGHSYAGIAGALQFLYGMQPDSLIIAVTEEDQYENILGNIRVARAYTQAELLCFLFTGNGDDVRAAPLKARLITTGPVLSLDDPGLSSKMLNLVQDYFSEKIPTS